MHPRIKVFYAGKFRPFLSKQRSRCFIKKINWGCRPGLAPQESSVFFYFYSQAVSEPLLSIGSSTCPDSNLSFAERMCEPFILLLSVSKTVQGTDAQRIPVDGIDFCNPKMHLYHQEGEEDKKE